MLTEEAVPTTATVEVHQMTAVAVLLAKGLVRREGLRAELDDGNRRHVVFYVECEPEVQDEVEALVARVRMGLHGIEGDLGDYQDGFRIVKGMMDLVRPRA
jgi:hypothetical protein